MLGLEWIFGRKPSPWHLWTYPWSAKDTARSQGFFLYPYEQLDLKEANQSSVAVIRPRSRICCHCFCALVSGFRRLWWSHWCARSPSQMRSTPVKKLAVERFICWKLKKNWSLNLFHWYVCLLKPCQPGPQTIVIRFISPLSIARMKTGIKRWRHIES